MVKVRKICLRDIFWKKDKSNKNTIIVIITVVGAIIVIIFLDLKNVNNSDHNLGNKKESIDISKEQMKIEHSVTKKMEFETYSNSILFLKGRLYQLWGMVLGYIYKN